jgi:hypothetical protein
MELRVLFGFLITKVTGWKWWYGLVIPVLMRLSYENLEFEVSLGYIARLCWKGREGRKEGK